MVIFYMDTCGKSRANTCTKAPHGVYLLDKSQRPRATVNHNNCSNRMALRRRCFDRPSALSTFDGRIEAYHGDDG